jgi:transcriptional regulator GlxA family with amidase domain
MRIAILGLDGLFDTGLTVLLDTFRLANNFSGLQTGGTSRFNLSIVGVRRRVRSGQGLSIPVQAITPRLKPDWVIVPALSTGSPEQLIPALERRDVIQAKVQLRKWHDEGAQLAASCIGTFLLAEAGLLDNGKPPQPGGWRRCSGSAIRTCCSMRPACWCRQMSV